MDVSDSETENPCKSAHHGHVAAGRKVTVASTDAEACRLLRAIARQSADKECIVALAERVSDWSAVADLAAKHKVAPMVYLSLAASGASVPPEAQARLRADYESNALHNLVNASELVAVLADFNREGIEAIPFKGIVLGASVYGNPMARHGGDIDVLIRQRDLLRATELLEARGYTRKLPTEAGDAPPAGYDHEYTFFRAADGVVLELRWQFDLVHARFHCDLGLDWVWPDRRSAVLGGAEIPDLSRESTLLVLCMHGSWHTWSRLVWICDVAQLLAVAPDLNWKIAMRDAKRLGLWRALALGVLLAHRVCGAAVPPAILRKLESVGTARRLAKHFEENLFESPGVGPVGRVPYNLQLLDFPDRLRLFFSGDILRPNENDRALVALPPWLDPLYYLIRPFRVLRDRSAR